MEINESKIIDESKIINTFVENYLVNVNSLISNELFVIFEIINKAYKETNVCQICNSHYRYNDMCIGVECGCFYINNGKEYNLVIPINNCPVCGRNTSK